MEGCRKGGVPGEFEHEEAGVAEEFLGEEDEGVEVGVGTVDLVGEVGDVYNREAECREDSTDALDDDEGAVDAAEAEVGGHVEMFGVGEERDVAEEAFENLGLLLGKAPLNIMIEDGESVPASEEFVAEFFVEGVHVELVGALVENRRVEGGDVFEEIGQEAAGESVLSAGDEGAELGERAGEEDTEAGAFDLELFLVARAFHACAAECFVLERLSEHDGVVAAGLFPGLGHEVDLGGHHEGFALVAHHEMREGGLGDIGGHDGIAAELTEVFVNGLEEFLGEVHDAFSGAGGCDDECHEVGKVGAFGLAAAKVEVGESITAGGEEGVEEHVHLRGCFGHAECALEEGRELGFVDVGGDVESVGRQFKVFQEVFHICKFVLWVQR